MFVWFKESNQLERSKPEKLIRQKTPTTLIRLMGSVRSRRSKIKTLRHFKNNALVKQNFWVCGILLQSSHDNKIFCIRMFSPIDLHAESS